MAPLLAVLVVALVVVSSSQSILPWGPCRFDTPYPPGTYMCANVTRPLDYSDPNGRQIEVHITRIQTPASKADLWFNTGGPSHTGGDLLLGNYGLAAAGFTVYYPETRGLLWSTPLDCPGDIPALNGSCLASVVAQWGVEGVRCFSLTNAARDVAYMMNATLFERSQRPVHMYGVSFGTALSNRILQVVDPTVHAAMTTVVLDSIFAPHFAQFQESDQNYGAVGDRIFELCDTDPYCGAVYSDAFDQMASVVIDEVFHELDTQGPAYQCLLKVGVENPSSMALKGALLENLGAEGFFQRTLVAPIIFRIHRCNADDVVALGHMKDQFVPLDVPAIWPGNALMANIFLSPDFWMQNNPLYTPQQLQMYARDNHFSNFSDWGLLMRNAWDLYLPDRYFAQPANYSMPTLFLNGELDANTAIGWAAGLASLVPGATFVPVPYCPHVVIAFSPTLNGKGTCGTTMAFSWIMSNGASVDTSCLADLMPLDFAAKTPSMQAIAMAAFGTTNMFGV